MMSDDEDEADNEGLGPKEELDVEFDSLEDKEAVEVDLPERLQQHNRGRPRPDLKELHAESDWIAERIFPGPERTEVHSQKIFEVLKRFRLDGPESGQDVSLIESNLPPDSYHRLVPQAQVLA